MTRSLASVVPWIVWNLLGIFVLVAGGCGNTSSQVRGNIQGVPASAFSGPTVR